uniref:Cyclin_C domain-containing protein n=1 Tax=Haemonchus contortus TaxID=6289 RepID=A0A7I4YPL3_HAECO
MRQNICDKSMPSQPPKLTSDCELSEFQMNSLCMRYGIPGTSIPSENALVTAATAVVRDSLKCYEPGKRVSKRDIERAKIDVQIEAQFTIIQWVGTSMTSPPLDRCHIITSDECRDNTDCNYSF